MATAGSDPHQKTGLKNPSWEDEGTVRCWIGIVHFGDPRPITRSGRLVIPGG
jgi:hypothetical protein